MTKKQLLETLKASTLKNDAKKGDLYIKYYPVIEALLMVFPKNAELDGLPVLDDDNAFKDFENFIILNSYEVVDKKLASLQGQLNMWVNSHAEARVVLNYIDRKKKIGTIFFIAFLTLICLASLVLAIITWLGLWEYDNQFSLALDTVGLISGLVFFAYEQITDNKKANVQSSAVAPETTEERQKLKKQYEAIQKKEVNIIKKKEVKINKKINNSKASGNGRSSSGDGNIIL